jgi:nucleoid-associated protein YgaU
MRLSVALGATREGPRVPSLQAHRAKRLDALAFTPRLFVALGATREGPRVPSLQAHRAKRLDALAFTPRVVRFAHAFLGAMVLVLLAGVMPALVRADVALVHIVRTGETLASIAELYYGDPRRESVLVSENGLTTEGGSAIEIGLRLVIPTVSYHTVEEDETWAELATRFYGDPRRAFVLIEANNGKSGGVPDTGAELLVPYPLRHVAEQNEPLRKLAKTYYDSNSGVATIRRFNENARTRVVRGQIVLVPLPDLVLGAQGKKLAEAQSQIAMGGEVRKKQAEIDEQLPVLREHVRAGRYADAVAMANRLIGGDDLSGSQIETVHRELGTALCALGQEELAQQAFEMLLEQQPDAELDTIRTSPKVLRVFDAARKAYAQLEAEKEQQQRAPAATKSKEPPAARKAKNAAK